MKTILISSLLFSGISIGATIFDESINGELSDDNTMPTALTGLSVGSNVIIGTLLSNPDDDREYFTITVPTGFTWSGLVIDSYVGTPFEDQSFLAYVAGDSIVSPTSASANDLDGNGLFGQAQIGNDIFPALTGANSALPAGDYTFWFQETAPVDIAYELDIQLAAVPEPSSAFLGLLGLVGMMGRRRR